MSQGLAAACVAVLVGGCTPAPSAGPSPSLPTSSTTAGSPSSGASVGARTLDITVRDGQVSPNAEKVEVTRGQTVVLRVTSDVEDEVHAHTAGDGFELEVHPGHLAQGQFVADDPGTFEVELHQLGKIVAILVVR